MDGKFSHGSRDIVETVLRRLKEIWANKPSYRLVHFQALSLKELGLEGVNRAFNLTFAGGQHMQMAVIDSWLLHDGLLRKCKERGEFIPLLVETGNEKLDELVEALLRLFQNGLKFMKRKLRKNTRDHERRGKNRHVHTRGA